MSADKPFTKENLDSYLREWIRTMFLGEHTFFGRLLNEPYGDLDFHEGEIIEFQMIQSGKDENNRFLVTTGRKAELAE